MWIRCSAGVAAGLLLWAGPALAQVQPAPANPAPASRPPANCGSNAATQGGMKTPETIKGQVTKVDPDQGKLTMRESDGKTVVFRAPKEVIARYKVGDQIQAKLRPSESC